MERYSARSLRWRGWLEYLVPKRSGRRLCRPSVRGIILGHALPGKDAAYVREDLPQCVRKFVTTHELYHLQDTGRWWVWREIKANAKGALKHPLGFMVCVLLSLTPPQAAVLLAKKQG